MHRRQRRRRAWSPAAAHEGGGWRNLLRAVRSGARPGAGGGTSTASSFSGATRTGGGGNKRGVRRRRRVWSPVTARCVPVQAKESARCYLAKQSNHGKPQFWRWSRWRRRTPAGGASVGGASPHHAAAVSRALRAAADTDAVWSCFLPRDLPPLAAGELFPVPRSSMGRFLRLSDRPVLLADSLMSVWLDRETGAKCYMMSARALRIAWGDTPQYWRWIPLSDSRFSEGAELLLVWWLEIRGKIHSKMLSQDSTYAAYIVFKIADGSYGLNFPPQNTSTTVAGSTKTRKVCLDNEHGDDAGSSLPMQQFGRRRCRVCCRNSVLPQKRTDGWMELEMGEFYNKDGDNGEVCISLMETKGGNTTKGLVVQGIEIRPKKGLVVRSSAHSLLPVNSPPTLDSKCPEGCALKPNSVMSESKPKHDGEAQEARDLMDMAAFEVMPLPDELLSAVISLMTPRDACRAATVSRTFHTAVDSDAVCLSGPASSRLTSHICSPSMRSYLHHYPRRRCSSVSLTAASSSQRDS